LPERIIVTKRHPKISKKVGEFQSFPDQGNTKTKQAIERNPFKAAYSGGAMNTTAMETTINLPLLLTVSETAKYLRVSNQAVYSWIHRKRLPAVKTGLFQRINARVLDERVKNNKILDN